MNEHHRCCSLAGSQQEQGPDLWLGVLPAPPYFHQLWSVMPRHNWVTATTQQSRFDEPEVCWLEMQQRMNRWGGGHTWERLQQLGAIAKAD